MIYTTVCSKNSDAKIQITITNYSISYQN